ncbi:MAG: O-antigen ligase family protein [Aerococcaceae bacterium]|nr:O-antigen ligase family protein [Aerococcaceae bacterium]
MSRKIAVYSLLSATFGIVFPFYVSGLLVVIALVAMLVDQRKLIFTRLKTIGWLGVFIVFAGVNAALNRHWIGAMIAVAMFLFAIFFNVVRQYMTLELYQCCLKLLSLGNIVAGSIACWNYMSYLRKHAQAWTYILTDPSPRFRAESTFFNANYYGMFCLFVLVIHLYLWQKKPTKLWRFVYIISSFLAVIGLILTASRMVYLALAAAIVWFILSLDKRWLKWTLIGSVVVVAIIIAKPTLLPRMSSLQHAVDDRLALWQTGWQIFIRNPLLGRGPLSYVKYYYLFDTKAAMHSHQLLIEMLGNYGLYGLFLLTIAVTPFIRRMVAAYQNPSVRQEWSLATSAIVIVLVHGLTDVSVFWLQTGYVFLVLLLPFYTEGMVTHDTTS